jgi:hypothetical protein
MLYPEVSSKVYHDSFCQLDSNVSLPWVIYFEAFCLHVVSSFSCIPTICPKLVLVLTRLQFVHFFCNLSEVYPAVMLMRNTTAYPTHCHPHLLTVFPVLTNEEMTTESQRYNRFTSNAGNAIPKHSGPEAKGSNPTAVVTLL